MNFSPASPIFSLATGTVIRVSHGAYDHIGMLADYWHHGERMVIALSEAAGGLVEQPFSSFACGRSVTVDGYLGRLPPAMVMHRARSKRGQTYSWTGFNCEHLVRFAHGVPVESPQLKQWAFLGLLSLVMLSAARA